VIYGLLTETSIGKLFIAGIIPGFLGIVFYLIAVQISVFRNPAAGPAGRKFSVREKLEALSGVWSVLLLFFLVIGGLYGALDFWPLNLTFSPTEAAGMGAMGAFLIALFRGSLSFGETMTVLKETAITTAQLFSVLIGAWIFSNFVNYAGLPEALKDMIVSCRPLAVAGHHRHPADLCGARLRVRKPLHAASDRADLLPHCHRPRI
jgi:C4-dicarboxylate transporter DctM subunit